MNRFLHGLKVFFIPCAENSYRPGCFSKKSIVAILAIVILLWGGYFVQTKIVFLRTNFLAAVLPGVLTALANNDRVQNGIPTLTEDPVLTQAAQNKANDMASKGYFSHVTPDGKTPWYWLDALGYNYTYAGENLAVDFTDSKDVEDAWMKSPTHRANIMKAQFSRVGIAVAQGMYQGKEATFVVQFFSRPLDEKVKPLVANSPPSSGDVPANELATSVPINTLGLNAPATPSSILGAETVSETPASSSTPNVVTASEVESVSTGETPSYVTPPSFASRAIMFMAVAVTSPTYTLWYIIGALMTIIAILLFLAVFIQVRIQYLEMVGGGLVLLAIAGGMFLFAGQNLSDVHVPTDTQAASVYKGLEALRGNK
ncbi:MAG: CAP domain-containing protein [Candidatus Pacebacteria bacterium]|nr:CAP domain-containing protein [Candidatus Paceibacterota bacterium]